MTVESTALKEKMERSSRIAIVIPPDASEETYLAALALAGKAEGRAFVAGAPPALTHRWQALFGHYEEPKKEFTIIINTAEHPVESLKYETRDNQLKIFLSPPAGLTRAQSRMLPEYMRFEEAYPRSSLVIALGFSSREQEEEIVRDFPLEEEGERISLGAPSETMGFSPLKLFARMILRARQEPADLDDSLHFTGETPRPHGEAGSGHDTSILWSFISREDFTKTDTTSPYIPPLLSLWQKIMPRNHFTVFLWQEKETEQIGGLIHSHDTPALERIARALDTRLASDYFIVPPVFSTFTEAEFKIRRLVKEVG